MIGTKLFRSKCPYCKEHGIPALKTGRNFSDETVRCKNCGKAFATNRGINALVLLGSLALVAWACIGWLPQAVSDVTVLPYLRGLLCGAWFVLLYVYEYFAPLHERDE